MPNDTWEVNLGYQAHPRHSCTLPLLSVCLSISLSLSLPLSLSLSLFLSHTLFPSL